MNRFAVISVFLSAFILLPACQTNPSGRTYSGSGTSSEAAKIRQASRAALDDLYAQNDGARRMGSIAQAVLVFPGIYKGGFLFGGAGGKGTLFYPDGRVSGYYKTASASYGLQAGLQKYSYALFMMDMNAVRQLNRAGGWEIGSSPSLVVVDEGVTGSLSSTTMTRGIYVVFFNQTGLMAGLSLEGTKITRIYP